MDEVIGYLVVIVLVIVAIQWFAVTIIWPILLVLFEILKIVAIVVGGAVAVFLGIGLLLLVALSAAGLLSGVPMALKSQVDTIRETRVEVPRQGSGVVAPGTHRPSH